MTWGEVIKSPVLSAGCRLMYENVGHLLQTGYPLIQLIQKNASIYLYQVLFLFSGESQPSEGRRCQTDDLSVDSLRSAGHDSLTARRYVGNQVDNTTAYISRHAAIVQIGAVVCAESRGIHGRFSFVNADHAGLRDLAPVNSNDFNSHGGWVCF